MYRSLQSSLKKIITLSLLVFPPLFPLAPKCCTVFVHGTVASILMMMASPVGLVRRQDPSALLGSYLTSLHRNRNSTFQNGHLMPQGLTFLSPEMLQDALTGRLDAVQSQRGAYYLMGMYDACMRQFYPQVDHKCVMFGWNGLFNESARRDAGRDLYHALCKIRAQSIIEDGRIPEIWVVAQSYGGVVAYWSLTYEEEFKQGITIDHLITLGTPLHKEAAAAALSPHFKRITTISSFADWIQVSDWMTTPDRKRKKRFLSDFINLHQLIGQDQTLQRCDLTFWAKGKSASVTHGQFCIMHNHKWWEPLVAPFPVSAFVPAIVATATGLPTHTSARVEFSVEKGSLIFERSVLFPAARNSVAVAPPVFGPWKAACQKFWDKSGNARRPVALAVFPGRTLLDGILRRRPQDYVAPIPQDLLGDFSF